MYIHMRMHACTVCVCVCICVHLMLPDACVWMSEVSIRLRKNGLLNLEFTDLSRMIGQ